LSAYLTVEDVAEALRVSQATALRLMKHEMAHVVVDHRLLRVTPEELDAYCRRRTEAPWRASQSTSPTTSQNPGQEILTRPRIVHPRTRRPEPRAAP
jgi:hypothetical protein